MVRALVKDNPNTVHIKNINMQSPLHTAAHIHNEGCLKELMKYGCNVHQRDRDGFTPSNYACISRKYCHKEEHSNGDLLANVRNSPPKLEIHLYDQLCVFSADPNLYEGLPLKWKYMDREQMHLEWREKGDPMIES